MCILRWFCILLIDSGPTCFHQYLRDFLALWLHPWMLSSYSNRQTLGFTNSRLDVTVLGIYQGTIPERALVKPISWGYQVTIY